MWVIKRTEEYINRSREYEKKHRRELAAVLNNLDIFLETLNNGVKPREAKFGFIHPEPIGVLAIDQKRGGPGLAETRLYVYPDETRKVLYLLTLGDKKTQSQDIKNCKGFVPQILKLEADSDARQPDVHERQGDGP